MKTTIAYGAPNKHNTPEAHGSPLGEEEIKLTKQNLGWPWMEPFYVPDEALQHCRQAIVRGEEEQDKWKDQLSRYESEFPEAAVEYKLFLSGGLPEGWDEDSSYLCPRKRTDGYPLLIGPGHTGHRQEGAQPRKRRSRPLPFDRCYIKEGGDLKGDNFMARNVHYGIREHGMGSILNGIVLHKGLIPFGSTFLIFYDYMRPPLRLAAIMRIPTIMVYTHDSIGLGEDGPTHQPVEMLAGMRSVPNLWAVRPADANEVCLRVENSVAKARWPYMPHTQPSEVAHLRPQASCSRRWSVARRVYACGRRWRQTRCHPHSDRL